jgi:hypothetical protein
VKNCVLSQAEGNIVMNNYQFESQSMKVEAEASIVNLEEMTDSVWLELHGTVDTTRIRHILIDLLLKYQDARILTFLPILMRRDAIEILRQ